MDSLQLLPTERDFAVWIGGIGSVERSIDSFLACIPFKHKKSGAAFLVRSPQGTPGRCRGNLGNLCLTRLIEGEKPHVKDAARILELGHRGRVEGRLCLIGDQFENPDLLCSIERMAHILIAHLGRLENRELQTRAMEQAELQVRELRHRLRNSMQLSMNLLRDLAIEDGPSSEQSVPEMLSRIHALFAIQEIYIWEGLSGPLELGYFLNAMVRTLRSLLVVETFISLELENDLQWHLNLHRATCLALIFYELAINSSKHTQTRPLQLRIAVRKERRSLVIRYSDDSARPTADSYGEGGRGTALADAEEQYGDQAGTGSGIIAALCRRMGARSRTVSCKPYLFEVVLAPSGGL